ncbi:MAG: hypothetical protein QM784_26825 [Polyangiaceae bacterium]
MSSPSVARLRSVEPMASGMRIRVIARGDRRALRVGAWLLACDAQCALALLALRQVDRDSRTLIRRIAVVRRLSSPRL